ncbi:MAG: SPOR domain-containing protein [Bacteroidaceae bacterium]|nr:SPOR domain-containing protein [Bacteroidaceae bacterium]MBO7589623.1 SPOR domain-containing protein [Bacteroidaceae bacterium]MBP5646025.1 SPOR domain-containing protein [Bacteroidaceae bacterium]
MKKGLVYMLVAGSLLSLASCKSSENAYRQAYEKAIQNDEPKTETVVSQPVSTAQVKEESKEADAAVTVREERVSVVSGGNSLKAYSVVCGSFSLKTNADALRDRLAGDGYSALVVVNEAGKTYRVICSSHDTKEEAVSARNSFKARYPDNSDFQNSWILYNR